MVANRIMVELDEVASNQLLEILEDWECVLQAEKFDFEGGGLMTNSNFKNDAINPIFNAHSSGKRFPSQTVSKSPPPYSIRFIDKERAILMREARDRSWAEYIRERVFRNEVTLRQRGRKDTLSNAVIGKALGDLGRSRLAFNMNQIAKAMNMGALPVTDDLEVELRDACAGLPPDKWSKI